MKEGGFSKRWMLCPKMGSLIENIFYPFKTIIDNRFDNNIPPIARFNVETLESIIEETSMNLILDLTKGDKYYKAPDLKEISHIKIRDSETKGPPSLKDVRKFNKAVKLSLNYDNFYKIGVYCAYGYNRTGFLIVSYLVLEKQYSLKNALQIFAESRPPGIYKPEFLKKLINYYDPDLQLTIPTQPIWAKKAFKERTVPIPISESTKLNLETKSIMRPPSKIPPRSNKEQKKPERNISYETINEILEIQKPKSDSDIPVKTSFKKPNKEIKVPEKPVGPPPFHANIAGVIPITDKKMTDSLKSQVQTLLDTTRYGFIGHKYRMLTKASLDKYKSMDFYHTWQTNGKRYLIFIVGDKETFMIDENDWYYRANNLQFPHPHYPDRFLTDTILDGELAIDTIKNEKFYRYLISDIYALEGERINNTQLIQRLSMVQSFIIVPHANIPDPVKAQEPFQCLIKSMSEKIYLQTTWLTLQPTLPHKMTGLVFHPYDHSSYTNLTQGYIFIWQPVEFKFIKFKLKVKTESNTSEGIGELFVIGDLDPYARLKDTNLKSLNPYDNKIVRCILDVPTMTWSIAKHDPYDTLPISKWDLNDRVNDLINPLTFEDLISI